MNLNPRRWFSQILLSGALLLTTMAQPAAAQISIPIPGLGNIPINIPIPGMGGGYNNGGYSNGGYNNGGGYSNQPGLSIPIPGLGNVGISFPSGGGRAGYYDPGYQNGGYQNGGYNPGYQNPGYQNGGYNPGYQNPGYQNGGYQNGGYNPGYQNGGQRRRGGRQQQPGNLDDSQTGYRGSQGRDEHDHQSGPVGPGAPPDYGVIREQGQFIRVPDANLPVRVYSTDPSFDDVLSQAITEWNTAGAGQLFGQVSTPQEADFTIDWSGRGLPRDAAGVCVMTPGRSSVAVAGLTLDTRRRPTPRGNLTEVLMQELGHSLGLDHSEHPEDIMYDTMHERQLSYVEEARLTERDKQMVTWLYQQTAFFPIISQGARSAAYRSPRS